MNDTGPPQGYRSVTPLLSIQGAAQAVDFYAEAFGAEEVLRLVGSDGAIVHGEVRIGDSMVMVAESNPEWGNPSPAMLGGTACRVHLYVDDVDAVVARAVAAGAEIIIPVSDQFYGDRTGRVTDPFGHTWIISTRVEDMSPEEMQRRFEAWMAEMAAADEGSGS